MAHNEELYIINFGFEHKKYIFYMCVISSALVISQKIAYPSFAKFRVIGYTNYVFLT